MCKVSIHLEGSVISSQAVARQVSVVSRFIITFQPLALQRNDMKNQARSKDVKGLIPAKRKEF